jgi:hypothetical protein
LILSFLFQAYDWNESWVGKSNAAEAEETGSGKNWLYAILISCAILFTVSIVSIICIFVYFTGCQTNNAFITVTLILCIAITAAQLSGEEGSLLASASVCTWAIFLCYTAVSKNPDGECNPRMGEPDNLSIVLGIAVTIMSLGWTGWSYTAEDKLTIKSDVVDEDTPLVDETGEKKVTGIVTGTPANDDEAPDEASDGDDKATNDPKRLSNSWKLNVILATIACWMSMILTNFGQIAADGNAANPQVGRAGMWVVIASQWLALSLYLWTLVAPRLLPNREFS